MFPLTRVPFWYWFFEPQPFHWTYFDTRGIPLVWFVLRAHFSRRVTR